MKLSQARAELDSAIEDLMSCYHTGEDCEVLALLERHIREPENLRVQNVIGKQFGANECDDDPYIAEVYIFFNAARRLREMERAAYCAAFAYHNQPDFA